MKLEVDIQPETIEKGILFLKLHKTGMTYRKIASVYDCHFTYVAKLIKIAKQFEREAKYTSTS